METMKIKNVQSAIELFEKSAKRHEDATEQGNYIAANKAYKEISTIIEFLKSENAITFLKNLFNSPSISVRMWSATYLLATNESEAIKILEEISIGPGIYSLDAETTLSEWKKGNLKL
jgi:hypothetical protein